jgi:anthranilate synthase/aminodeoxychorismate synthase-like glutamine amidotransferase
MLEGAGPDPGLADGGGEWGAMILVIDNYDSFTYNLVQYLGELGAEMEVVRNDARAIDALAAMKPERVVISPGPGTPDDAGVSLDVIRKLGPTTPVLGVCLGHQAIGRAFGATVDRARVQMHGKTSTIRHDGRGVFAGLSNPFVATRYHSLVVLRHTVPPVLEVTAESEDGEIMGLRHREFPVEGVQFHPESILTTEGKDLLRNFLATAVAR